MACEILKDEITPLNFFALDHVRNQEFSRSYENFGELREAVTKAMYVKQYWEDLGMLCVHKKTVITVIVKFCELSSFVLILNHYPEI